MLFEKNIVSTRTNKLYLINTIIFYTCSFPSDCYKRYFGF